MFSIMTLAFTVSEVGSPWKILSRGTTDALWSPGDGMVVMDTLVFWPGESPGTEEPGGLHSMGSQRLGHD